MYFLNYLYNKDIKNNNVYEGSKEMKELKITQIYENNQKIGYGGNQDWFIDDWAKKAGCGSVLGSNLYAYYMGVQHCTKDEFLVMMNDLYRYMTPGRMGFPFFYKFAHQFVLRMKLEDVHLKPNYLKKSKSIESSIQFVKKGIDGKNPIGALILSHKAKELEEDNWHWICISGYEEKDNQVNIIFSDCGRRRVIEANVLFEIDPRNIVKLVYFNIM